MERSSRWSNRRQDRQSQSGWRRQLAVRTHSISRGRALVLGALVSSLLVTVVTLKGYNAFWGEVKDDLPLCRQHCLGSSVFSQDYTALESCKKRGRIPASTDVALNTRLHTFLLVPEKSGGLDLLSLLATSPRVRTLCKASPRHCDGQNLGIAEHMYETDTINDLGRTDFNRLLELYKVYWDRDGGDGKDVAIEKSPMNVAKAAEIIQHFRGRESEVAFIIMTRSPCRGKKEHRRQIQQSMVLASIVQMLTGVRMRHIAIPYEHLVRNPCDVSELLLEFMPELQSLDPAADGLATRLHNPPDSILDRGLQGETDDEVTWMPGFLMDIPMAQAYARLGHRGIAKCANEDSAQVVSGSKLPNVTKALGADKSQSGRNSSFQQARSAIIYDFSRPAGLTTTTHRVVGLIKVAKHAGATLVLSQKPCKLLDQAHTRGINVSCDLPWSHFWGEHAPELSNIPGSYEPDLVTRKPENLEADFNRAQKMQKQKKAWVWKFSGTWDAAWGSALSNFLSNKTDVGEVDRQWIAFPRWTSQAVDSILAANKVKNGQFDLVLVGVPEETPNCDTRMEMIIDFVRCSRFKGKKSNVPLAIKMVWPHHDPIGATMKNAEVAFHVDEAIQAFLPGHDNYQVSLVGKLMATRARYVYPRWRDKCLVCASLCQILYRTDWSPKPMTMCGQ